MKIEDNRIKEERFYAEQKPVNVNYAIAFIEYNFPRLSTHFVA